jgi:hypothetical protein
MIVILVTGIFSILLITLIFPILGITKLSYLDAAFPIMLVIVMFIVYKILNVGYNQFGIYENRITPPVKPESTLSPKRVFIPYNEIVSMELTEESGKKFLEKPYRFRVKLKNGKEAYIHPLELVPYIGENIKEHKKIYDMLCIVWGELNKKEIQEKIKQNERVIIERNKFKNIMD